MLSPEDIAKKNFNKKFHGYNPQEVNRFLNEVGKDYQFLRDDVNHTKDQVKHYKSEADEYQNKKKSLNQAILVAQEAANRVKHQSNEETVKREKESKQKAQDIINQAKRQSNSILANAAHKANRLSSETINLREGTMKYKKQMQDLSEKLVRYIKSNSWMQTLNGTKAQADKEDDNVQKFIDKNIKHPNTKASLASSKSAKSAKKSSNASKKSTSTKSSKSSKASHSKSNKSSKKNKKARE